MDVPTDCPQRDERLGWTADTQVFVNTACYNMDTYIFYKKYLNDLRGDQTMYFNGDIPMYSPSLKKEAGEGGAVWADAGTIIPWNLYLNYGDKNLLENPVFTKIAKKYKKTNAQVILRWHIQKGYIIFPRSRNPVHIKENINIFDFELTNEEIQEIDKLDKKKLYLNW